MVHFPSSSLSALWSRGADFLNCKYAILGGAMTWISESRLVSAISNAGGFGVIACGSMTPQMLDGEIKKTHCLTSNSFGVNLITMHPDLSELVEVCLQNRVSYVVLAGGLPKSKTINALKVGGINVICFAPALVLARRLVKIGADALVVEGSEAGGHIGPVSTSVLAQEILPAISEVPVFVAGGIGRGEAMASFLLMGAAGVQIGTRLVCANESIAHTNFKKAFVRAASRDAEVTSQLDKRFPVIPVRALVNSGTEEFMDKQKLVIDQYNNGDITMSMAQLEIEHFWAGSLRRAVLEGDVEKGSLMAGQSVGMVSKEQPVSEIIDEFILQANTFLAKTHNY
ncbi:MAG: 2-nitropropane dioxygenase [Rhodospirillaceae bacterium]|nr:2-nitropropane dioxygenase [Rhodospirillaceae bacterium]